MKHLTIKQRRILFPFLVLGVVFCFCRMRVKWRKGSFCDLVVWVLGLIFCEAFFFLKILQQQSTLLLYYIYTRCKGCPADEAQFIYYWEDPPQGVTTWLSWVWYKSTGDLKGQWQQWEKKTCNILLNCPFTTLPAAETGFQLHSCCGFTKPLWPEEAQKPCLCCLPHQPGLNPELLCLPDLVSSLCPPGLPWRGTDHPCNWIWPQVSPELQAQACCLKKSNFIQ